MIQEILDYLLIKKELLTLSKEEILAKLDNEDTLALYCKMISEMSKQDAFLYTHTELMQKVQAIVYEKRFSCKHSKEVIDNMNDLLDYVHKYRTLSDSEKCLLRRHWVKEEKESRKLPLRKFPGFYYTIGDIYELIRHDYDSLRILSGDFLTTPFNKLFQLSTINWICSNYSKTFSTNFNLLTMAIFLCSIIEDDTVAYSKMVKETKIQLESIRNEVIEEAKKVYKKEFNQTKD